MTRMKSYFQLKDSHIPFEDLCEASDEKEVFLIEDGVEKKVGEMLKRSDFTVDGKSAIRRVQTFT